MKIQLLCNRNTTYHNILITANNIFIPGESCKIKAIIESQKNDANIVWLKEKIKNGWQKEDLKYKYGSKYYNNQQYITMVQECLI